MAETTDITVRYKSRVTSRVSFFDHEDLPVSPTEVELHIGGDTFDLLSGVVEVDTGVFEYEWVSTAAGSYHRLWVGESIDFYAESELATIHVAPSKLNSL